MYKNTCKCLAKIIPLQRVFHSIRFKVNKVGVQRYSFFYARKLSVISEIKKKNPSESL